MARRTRLSAAVALFACSGFLLPVQIFAAPVARPVAAVSSEATLADAVQRAVSKNAAVADAAIARLRAEGPDGLKLLFETYGKQIEAADDADPMWPHIRHAVENVAAQRDAHVSKLFWYKDLEQAQAAAKATGKPILSLRMMGQLDEEFSCANSRFFRILLYSNAEISQYLRENYILHWRSVRPVPKVTIDFGDGRKLERTITGNSIHYILDADGRVVDALPGLYAPERFLSALREDVETVHALADRNPAERKAWLAANWSSRESSLLMEWESAARQNGVTLEDRTPKIAEARPIPTATAAEPVSSDASAGVAAPPTAIKAADGPEPRAWSNSAFSN